MGQLYVQMRNGLNNINELELMYYLYPISILKSTNCSEQSSTVFKSTLIKTPLDGMFKTSRSLIWLEMQQFFLYALNPHKLFFGNIRN